MNKKTFISENELKVLAKRLSETITIRTYINGNSYDDTRPTTETEKDILYKILFGTLLGLNYDTTSYEEDMGIVHTAEFITKQIIPECNGYDTVYLPLKGIIEDWRKEQ